MPQNYLYHATEGRKGLNPQSTFANPNTFPVRQVINHKRRAIVKNWSPTHLSLIPVYEGKEGHEKLILTPVTLGLHSLDAHAQITTRRKLKLLQKLKVI